MESVLTFMVSEVSLTHSLGYSIAFFVCMSLFHMYMVSKNFNYPIIPKVDSSARKLARLAIIIFTTSKLKSKFMQ